MARVWEVALREVSPEEKAAAIEALRGLGKVARYPRLPRNLRVSARPGQPDIPRERIEAVPAVLSPEDGAAPGPSLVQTHDYRQAATGAGGSFGHALHALAPPLKSLYDIKPGADEVFRCDYSPADDGTGCDIYVVDSGVDAHPDLSGRIASRVYDAYPGDPLWYHGTAVAGCAAGSALGTAPGATILDARAFGTSGESTASGINAALNACVSSFASRNRPAVLNASFRALSTTGPSDAAFDACVDAGLVVVVAAGNDNYDLRSGLNVWPAERPDVLTVGAINERGWLTDYTNYRGATDLYVLGDYFAGLDVGGGYRRVSGTSFSSPTLAGFAARKLAERSRLTSRAAAEAFLDEMRAEGVADVRGKGGAADPVFSYPRYQGDGMTRVGLVASPRPGKPAARPFALWAGARRGEGPPSPPPPVYDADRYDWDPAYVPTGYTISGKQAENVSAGDDEFALFVVTKTPLPSDRKVYFEIERFGESINAYMGAMPATRRSLYGTSGGGSGLYHIGLSFKTNGEMRVDGNSTPATNTSAYAYSFQRVGVSWDPTGADEEFTVFTPASQFRPAYTLGPISGGFGSAPWHFAANCRDETGGFILYTREEDFENPIPAGYEALDP